MAKKKQDYPIPTYLEWADAIANSSWFTTEDAVRWADKGEWFCSELGWIIKETKEYILFAGRRNPESQYSEEKWGNLQKIPKTWIRNRKVVRV